MIVAYVINITCFLFLIHVHQNVFIKETDLWQLWFRLKFQTIYLSDTYYINLMSKNNLMFSEAFIVLAPQILKKFLFQQLICYWVLECLVFLLSHEFFILCTAAVLVKDLSPHTWITTTVSWVSASRLFIPLRSLFHCRLICLWALLSLLLCGLHEGITMLSYISHHIQIIHLILFLLLQLDFPCPKTNSILVSVSHQLPFAKLLSLPFCLLSLPSKAS